MTHPLLLPIAALLGGLVLLGWSADRFVAGAAATARALGMSLLMIGLTIVSFGTSAPEILVSAIAALTGVGELAVGNALGSNIANVGLVLGVTALIAPIVVPRDLFHREFPLLLLATALGGYCLWDLRVDHIDGILLACGLAFVLWRFVTQGRASTDAGELDREMQDSIPALPLRRALWLLFTGLLVLLISSRMLVWGATELALAFGVSELVIGLTIVAIGTSLPELAAAVASALKQHHDIVIGTVVGSNLFNLLGVLAIPGLVEAIPLEAAVFWRDYLAMAGMTVFMILFAWLPPRHPTVDRIEGGLLLALYFAFLGVLYLTMAA